MLLKQSEIHNQFIKEEQGVSVFLKREDLLHSEISGNKFRKLKFNMEAALFQKKKTVLTFGGAFSNHIAATAAAAKLAGLAAIGIIRGEELGGENLEKTLRENASLRFADSCDMKLKFISRTAYRTKTAEAFTANLQQEFGDFYLIPEGGTNTLAVKGCEEILTKSDEEFDFICCAVGTGGTLAGLSNSAKENQKILGFSVLKGDFLTREIEIFSKKNNWELIPNYHFGGYAKVNVELVKFINNFGKIYGTALDPIYTGKMMFGIFDLLQKGCFPKHSKILAVHTGGLQGIAGMNQRLHKKGLAQLDRL